MALTPKTQLPQREQIAARLPLPENAPFLIYVDRGRVKLIEGEFRYNPVKVPIEAGAQGVTDRDDSSMRGYQETKLKRIPVPLDFEVIAWGERVGGYMIEKDIGRDALGKQLWHYHDVWTRYEMIGNSMIVEFDHEGWADFCRRVEALVGQPPHAQIARMEAKRMTRAARTQRRISDRSPVAKQTAERIEAALETAEKPPPAPPAEPEKPVGDVKATKRRKAAKPEEGGK